MPGGVFANSPCGLKHAKPFFRPSHPPVGASEGTEKAGDQRPVSNSIPGEARCIRKARSDPAEQRTSRRGLPARLSEPEGRVPRRPPAGSSAGQSFAQRMTGVAGSPSLLTFLATQESQSAAGPRPGQRYAKHGKTGQQGRKGFTAQYPPPGPAYGSPCLYDAANPEVAAASNRESTPTAMKRAPALR